MQNKPRFDRNKPRNATRGQSNRPKERDINEVVFTLQRMFRTVTMRLNLGYAKRDNATGEMNRMYILERDMAYLINEMQVCAACIQQDYITEANHLIDVLLREANELNPRSNTRGRRNQR